jgi:hypothetical protein
MSDLQDAIARDQEHYRSQTAAHVEKIVQLLSLQPEDSPVHNVEAYRDGLRVPVYLTNLTVYVYCLPWARGWSIFTSQHADDMFSFSWRTIVERWRPYQLPVYCPRDTWGPYNCSPEQVAAAFEYTVRRVKNIDKRRRAALRGHGWTY